MPYIHLNFPVQVQQTEVNGQMHYFLKPLFLNHPIAVSRRYNRAVTKLQTEIRRLFRGYTLATEQASQLLWFMFYPKLTYGHYYIDITTGRQHIVGTFAVAYFKYMDYMFICLPAFDSHFSIAEVDENGRCDVRGHVSRLLEDRVRQHRKNYNENLDLKPYEASKGAFVTKISFALQVGNGAFSFEHNPLDLFFAQFGRQDDFRGDVEIEKVGADLSDRYPNDMKRAYLREELVGRLSDNIYSPDNVPIVLVGDEGVGKSSVLHEVVYRYRQQQEGERYENLVRMWHIDPTRIIAGMSIVGLWQKRFEAILNYMVNRRREAIRGIDRFQNDRIGDKMLISNPIALLRIGKSSQNAMTLGDVLRTYLEKRQVQCILLATPDEWKTLQEKDRRLADLFQVIRINPPTVATAVQMAIEQRRTLELEYNCVIRLTGVHQLFVIQRSYLRHKALPGSVINLMRQMAAKYKNTTIDAAEVRNEFEHYSGLNLKLYDDQTLFARDEMHQAISAKLVGQPQAVDCLTDVIGMVKAKLNNPEKPLGSFFFIGPTGVGKTQAAKVLCEHLLESEELLLRFDMNEFIDDLAVHRLIGDYNNPEGLLTGRVRYRPFGIVLFDEIEKAHPKVHDLLLQVLDDARLTDSMGRTVSFANTIIILTSNVGAREVSSIVGFSTSVQQEADVYRKALENTFRPEFINRIDRVVIFNPLRIEEIRTIAHLQINELLSRDGFVRRTTMLNIDQQALDWVARRGFDSKMGGRALKRQIERDLTTLSAYQLNEHIDNQPIIFNITLQNNTLQPHITHLHFAQPNETENLPKVPNEKQEKRFYKKLLAEVENLKDQLNTFEEQHETQYTHTPTLSTQQQHNDDIPPIAWHYYALKNRLFDLEENIRRTLLGYGHDIITKNRIPLRTKKSKTFLNKKQTNANFRSDPYRQHLSDQYFQKDAIHELQQAHLFSPELFNRTQTHYLAHFAELQMLRLQAQHLNPYQPDHIKISFRSAINNIGDYETRYLLELYENLCIHLDIHHHTDRQNHTITAEGAALYQLLQHEAGFHLFYPPHKAIIPIQLTIHQLNKPQQHPPQQVIRLYHSHKIIADIRSGISNDFKITPDEHQLLLLTTWNTLLPPFADDSVTS
jgi:ATP-dependent Clp protease ATP-binding subunit ClpC